MTNYMSSCFWRQLQLWHQCENKIQQTCSVARRAADRYSINSTEEMFQKRHQVSWGMLLVQTSQLDPTEHYIVPVDENMWEHNLCVFEEQLPWSVCDCRHHLQLNCISELGIFVHLHKMLSDFLLRGFVKNVKFC